ncbi:MAG TPA: TetR/AcrR family transcriptional regulator [Candidatus Limnocylindrales bacterium]|nr:TetR/AcrR family transcriptional regulator [Candidatus Limnocylindrales bacterium]
MARTLNVATHAVRRDEILDVAERFIRARGYEAMSIQDLQDELGVSRGAIYHYFRSKEAILDALIERMSTAGIAVIRPIVEDPDLDAITKLQAVFATAGAWKAQRSDLLLAVLRSWYAPANDLVRLRAEKAANAQFVPLMAAIIRQGVDERVMRATSPEHAAITITALFNGSSDTIFRLLTDRIDGRISFEEVESFMAAYSEAMERILGLPPGSFVLIDPESLHTWFG